MKAILFEAKAWERAYLETRLPERTLRFEEPSAELAAAARANPDTVCLSLSSTYNWTENAGGPPKHFGQESWLTRYRRIMARQRNADYR